MKAYLILEDGTVFEGTSIGSKREIISEIVFNTSMRQKRKNLRRQQHFRRKAEGSAAD